MAQCPLLWEIRKFNLDDISVDNLVLDHYNGTGVSPLTDCSTGLGQLFAATTIQARNHCIGQGIISGTLLDPTNEAHLWDIWYQLYSNNTYNAGAVPLVLIEGAHDIGLARPGLDQSEEDTRKTLARYNGTNNDATDYGYQLLGLYKVFEKYHAPLRGIS